MTIVMAMVFGTAWANAYALVDGPVNIHRAAQAGDLAQVQELLKGSPDLLGALGDGGQTPLHFAVRARELDVAQFLLDQGADTEAFGDHHETPMHVAARILRPQAIELLLAHGADVNAQSKLGYTPLHLACYFGGDDKAQSERRVETCKLLLAAEANVSIGAADGTTALHLAAARGRSEVIDLLLSSMKVNTPDGLMRTPLHYASLYDHPETLKLLLAAKADVNAKDESGDTPLHSAARRFRAQTASLLLENGADVNAQNVQGETPLILLAANSEGSPEVDEGLTAMAKVLLAHKANIELKDNDGFTALHYAQENKYKKLADLLSKQGGK